MADIQIVAQVVGAEKVNALVNSTKKLEGQVKNLGNAYLSGKIGPEQFNKGLTELRKSANALYPTHQKASAVVTKLAKDYVNLTRAQQQDTAATKLYIQARREATAMNQRFNQEKKLEGMRVKQATQSLRAYTAASQASTVANKGNVKGTNNLGVIMQQTGYQVGDFAVQVQGGTNIAVAFGQQATQLVGALYLLPAPLLAAKVGILGLSISVTALIASFSIILPIVTGVVAYFMRSAEAAKASAKEVETLDDKLKSLDSTLRDWLRSKQAADMGITAEELLGIEGLDEANKRLEEANQRLIRLAASRKAVAQAGPEGAFIALGTALLNSAGFDSGTSDERQAAIEDYLKAIERVGQLQQKLDDEQYKNFSVRYVQLQQEIDLEQTRIKFGEDSVQAQNLELEQRILNMQKAVDEQVKANKMTENQGSLLKEAEENAMRLSVEVENMKGNLSGAADEAGRLVDNLVLGQGYLSNVVRAGVASGAIPPQALADLPQTDAERAMEQILDARRRAARSRTDRGESTGGGTRTSQASPLETLQKQIGLEQQLIGKSEEYTRVRQALGDTYTETEAGTISALEKQIGLINEAKEAEQERMNLMRSVESSLEQGFMSMIDGTKSVKDAFKSMAADIIKELYRVLVVKRMVSVITSFLGFADGGTFSGGSQIQAYANGGVVGGPTTFPMAGGKTGLMGEAGPEAIMPLKRGANGKLGVQMEGGGGDTIVVNQSFNFQANGDDSVKRIIAQAAPQIAQMTKKSMIDDRRRGGQMKATFG